MTEFFTVLGMIVAAAALLAIFVLSLRGTLTIAYDGEFHVSFRVLFINIPLFPLRKRQKHYRKSMSAWEARQIRNAARRRAEKRRLAKAKRAEKKPEDKKKEQSATGQKRDLPVGDIAREVIDILSVFTEVTATVVKRFTHHLRIKVARFKVKIATPDPAVTAITYGAASQIINVLLPILSQVEHLGLPKEKNFDVSYDFTAEAPDIDLKVSFSLRSWHMADIALRSLIGGFSKYTGRKGGVQNTLAHIGKLVGQLAPKDGEDKTNDEKTKNSI